MDHLEKVDDDLAQVMADRREAEEQNKLLSQMRDEKNKQYDKSYHEKIARVSATVRDSACSFALQVHHLCSCTFRHNSLAFHNI
jgi:hypothetical protein